MEARIEDSGRAQIGSLAVASTNLVASVGAPEATADAISEVSTNV